MARTGVQFLDIEKAALELQGFGKIPTVDGIREILGTGSKSTISKHLRAWRAKQTQAGGDLPHELAALVTGIWRKLHTDADQRVHESEATCHQQVQKLNQTITRLHQEQADLKNQLHKTEEMTAMEHSAKEKFEKQLQEKQQEQIKLHEQSQAISQQLEASKAENARIHQLTKNIQANLEHYQQEMHKHQLEQTLQTEKQHAFYVQEITALKQQLTHQQNQIKPLEQEKEKLQATLEQLDNQLQQLLAEQKTTQLQLQETNHEKSGLLERNKIAAETINALQNEINEAVTQCRELEKKTAILFDQNERLQKDLAQTQDKVETLRQEKLFLIQEKSQLEGYLNKTKHLEKSNH